MAKQGPAPAGDSTTPTDELTREQLLAQAEVDAYARAGHDKAAVNEPTETPGE